MPPESRANVLAVRAPRFSELTWTEAEALDPSRSIAILPVGAVEAHGPHLPLSTDSVISGAMAEVAAERLRTVGWEAVILPPFDYTAAPFAAGFPGTISVRPESVTALIVDIGSSLARRDVRMLAIANAHLDPANLGALHAAAEELVGVLPVAFPDLTHKPWGRRLTDEFKSGACHAGRFEGSIVLAARPDLVREEQRARLEPNPVSLATAIREGKGSFEEAGGPNAYFGYPGEATAEEGRATIETLGELLADAVLERLDQEEAG